MISQKMYRTLHSENLNSATCSTYLDNLGVLLNDPMYNRIILEQNVTMLNKRLNISDTNAHDIIIFTRVTKTRSLAINSLLEKFVA